MRRLRPSLWLGVLLTLAGAIWLIERLVVTDEEALEALVAQAAAAIRGEDPEALERTLAPEFEASGRDRAAAIRWIRTIWRRYRPFRLEVEVRGIEIEGDQATIDVFASMTVMARPVEVEMTVLGRNEAGEWRFTQADHRISVGAGASGLR